MNQSTLLRLRQTLRNVLEELEQELAKTSTDQDKQIPRRNYRKEVEATKQSFIRKP